MSATKDMIIGVSVGGAILLLSVFTVAAVLIRKRRRTPSPTGPNSPLIPTYQQERRLSQSPLTPASRGSHERFISVDLSSEAASPLEPPPLERRISITGTTKKGHKVSLSRDLQESVIAAQNEGSLPSYVVISDFEPKKRDELRLRIGEIVTVSMTFTDGWCHGYNTTTQKLGTFPLSSVAVLTSASSPTSSTMTAEQDLASTSPASPSSHLYSKAQEYTMVAPEQALEVVTKGLSAERRAAYFEGLLRTASLDEGTREQFKRAAAGAASKKEEEDVKAALLRHLEKGFKRWMDRVDENRFPGDKLRRTKTSAGKPGWTRPVPVRTQTL